MSICNTGSPDDKVEFIARFLGHSGAAHAERNEAKQNACVVMPRIKGL